MILPFLDRHACACAPIAAREDSTREAAVVSSFLPCKKISMGCHVFPSTPLLKITRLVAARMIAALLRVRGGAGLEKMCWIVGAADDYKPCRLAGTAERSGSGVGAAKPTCALAQECRRRCAIEELF